MILHCLGSSSRGNSYILQNKEEALIIEGGVRFDDVQRVLGFNIKKVSGALISHAHGDHAKYVGEISRRGITTLAHESVYETWGVDGGMCTRIQNLMKYKFGRFTVMPFQLIHDVPTFGFLISHPETGRLVFITDTAEVEYVFPEVRNILIEANYCEDIMYENVMRGSLNAVQQDRVTKSHLSIQKVEKWLKKIDYTDVVNIILLHLSDGNSNAKDFRERLSDRFAKNVVVADRGLDMEISDLPF